jgi:hypothetical protein
VGESGGIWPPPSRTMASTSPAPCCSGTNWGPAPPRPASPWQAAQCRSKRRRPSGV